MVHDVFEILATGAVVLFAFLLSFAGVLWVMAKVLG